MSEVPLDPQTDGKSISLGVLQVGDLVISTTPAWGSNVIRAITGGGPASHVRIYAGTAHTGAPSFIEAIAEGVSTTYADVALAPDTVAVGFRHPNRTDASAKAAVQYAVNQLGKRYDYWGAAADALFRYLNTKRRVNLRTPSNTFYCSKLAIEAYESAAMPLVRIDPQWSTPNDLVPLTWTEDLLYLGHLKFTS
jgi:uncharacterized protein YycO